MWIWLIPWILVIILLMVVFILLWDIRINKLTHTREKYEIHQAYRDEFCKDCTREIEISGTKNNN